MSSFLRFVFNLVSVLLTDKNPRGKAFVAPGPPSKMCKS